MEKSREAYLQPFCSFVEIVSSNLTGATKTFFENSFTKCRKKEILRTIHGEGLQPEDASRKAERGANPPACPAFFLPVTFVK